jgi:SAM-dependent methyltransferase
MRTAQHLCRFIRGLVKLSVLPFSLDDWHITRFEMYSRLKDAAAEKAQKGQRVLSISHSLPLCNIVGLTGLETVETKYPEVNVLHLPYRDDTFDFVVSDQVLEHVEGDPQQAVNESLRVLKPGGWVVLATCFLIPIHGAPSDYWRFTPESLVHLFRNSARVVQSGSWGNPLVPVMIAVGMQFQRVPRKAWHPIHRLARFNDREWPTVVWIIAER